MGPECRKKLFAELSEAQKRNCNRGSFSSPKGPSPTISDLADLARQRRAQVPPARGQPMFKGCERCNAYKGKPGYRPGYIVCGTSTKGDISRMTEDYDRCQCNPRRRIMSRSRRLMARLLRYENHYSSG